ncbi:MAG: nucleotide exchange factor GrpE [Desulfobacteraceae bacterium]
MELKQNKIILNIASRTAGFYGTLDRHFLLPLYRRISRFLNERCERKIKKYGLMSDWKERSLDDFKLWLFDIPETHINPDFENRKTDHDTIDLYTLLSEFAGLRQEIRLQNREQSKSITALNGFMDSFQGTFELLKRSSSDLQNLEANITRSVEKKALSSFFDVRDILERSMDAVRTKRTEKGMFSRGKKDLDGVMEAFEIAIRRFDRAMEFSGIFPVETLRKPFNPKTMKAVSAISARDLEKKNDLNSGYVAQQVSGGFTRGDEVLRYAEVVVVE